MPLTVIRSIKSGSHSRPFFLCYMIYLPEYILYNLLAKCHNPFTLKVAQRELYCSCLPRPQRFIAVLLRALQANVRQTLISRAIPTHSAIDCLLSKQHTYCALMARSTARTSLLISLNSSCPYNGVRMSI